MLRTAGPEGSVQLEDRIGAWLTPQGCYFRVWARQLLCMQDAAFGGWDGARDA